MLIGKGKGSLVAKVVTGVLGVVTMFTVGVKAGAVFSFAATTGATSGALACATTMRAGSSTRCGIA